MATPTDTTTANQLFKSATEKGLTNVPFAEWIENKNKEYVVYTEKMKGNSEMLSFVAWETENQKDKGYPKMNTNILPMVLLAVGIAVVTYMIYKRTKTK